MQAFVEKKVDYREMARMFKALSDETRLRIMDFIICEGRHCVREIAKALDISQTASSRNLSILREAGFLFDEREGPCIYYDIESENMDRIEFLMKQFK